MVTHELLAVDQVYSSLPQRHETNPTKVAIARKRQVGDDFSLSHGYQVTLLFLLHDHQDSLFARRQPPGVEGRGRVGRKIAV